MDSWEKFDETTLPDKEAFYSDLLKKGLWAELAKQHIGMLKQIINI